MTTEFVVPADKRCVIEQRIVRIQDVFDVGVRLCDPATDGDGEASQEDSGCVLQGPQTAERKQSIDNVTGLASGNVWVYVDGQDADKCQRAKEHIVSLCTESSIVEDCPLSVEPNMLDKRILCWEYESGAVIERLPGDRLRIQGPDENIIRAQSLMETVSPLWDDREQPCTSSDNDVLLQNGAIWRNDSTRTNTASPGADPGNFSNSSSSPRDLSDSVNSPRTNFSGSRSSPRLDFSSSSAGMDMVDGQKGLIPPQQGHQRMSSLPSMSSSSSSSALTRKGAVPAQQDHLREKAVPSLSSSSSSPSLSTSTSSSVSNYSPGKHEEIIALMQKLGYSRQMVEQVILQIGEHASSNEVLQMLVSQGSQGMEQDDAAGTANRSSGGSRSRSSSARDASDGVEDAEDKDADPYRAVIIDGSNVAMSYGNKNVFACKGIDTVVMWFLRRGHKVIYVFVPSWRKEQSKPETPIQDQEVLIELEKARILVWTPSRRVKGRRMVCYDDRYILNLAIELDGIIVSNDTFRDLCAEKPEYQKVVEERLLMYSFAGEKFMPPDDPLGRNGPNLDNFLRKTPSKPAQQMQPCPYGKKCTYGNKCKYGHPERSKNQRPMSEILVEKDRQRKEKRIITDLHARALNGPDPIQMRLEREVAEEDAQVDVIPVGGSKDHLGYSISNPSPRGADRNTFPGHGQVPPHHDSAATFPLMNQSRPESNLTVPLSQQQMASVQLQRLEDVSGGGNGGVYRARVGSALPAAGGLVSHQNYHHSWHDGHPDQRAMSGYHHPPMQPALHPVHSVQQRGQQQRSQQLPDRNSLTAPISGYTPLHHQAHQEQHLTAPLTAPLEPLQYHNPGQMRNRHSMPPNHRDGYAPSPHHLSNFARDGNPPLPQFRTEGKTSSHFTRDVSATGDILHDFRKMSLRDQSSVFEEERLHTFPLTNPHRSSPGSVRHNSDLSQSTMSLATDDEGYFSPRYPIEQTVASPLPVQQTATQGYPPHQGSDTRHLQSHAHQFMYPNCPSTHNQAAPSQSGWSQQQPMQGSKQVPQAKGRMEPQVGRPEPHIGHWGMHHGQGQQAMAPPQRAGEPPMAPRAGWQENDNRAMMPEYMRNPQNQL